MPRQSRYPCPNCNSEHDHIVNIRRYDYRHMIMMLRYRRCMDCGHKHRTIEITEVLAKENRSIMDILNLEGRLYRMNTPEVLPKESFEIRMFRLIEQIEYEHSRDMSASVGIKRILRDYDAMGVSRAYIADAMGITESQLAEVIGFLGVDLGRAA